MKINLNLQTTKVNIDESLQFLKQIKKTIDTVEVIEQSSESLSYSNRTKQIELNVDVLRRKLKNKLPIILDIYIFSTATDKIIVECKQLKISISTDLKDYTISLNRLIARCLGYKICILKGLKVRNSEGQKISSNIELYCKDTLEFEIPYSLEFVKDISIISEYSRPTLQCFSQSEILESILQTAGLTFKHGKDLYRISVFEQKYQIEKCTTNGEELYDLLHDRLAIKSYISIIEGFQTELKVPLIDSLKNRCRENQWKAFHNLLLKNLKYTDFPYLHAAVENAPLFHDSRDKFIENLRNFLSEKAPPMKLKNSGYLEIKKKRIPKAKGTHSLRKFLLKTHDCL